MKHKLESRLLGETSIISDDTTIMTESEEELKSLLIVIVIVAMKLKDAYSLEGKL